MESISDIEPALAKRDWKREFRNFWVAEVDAMPMRWFECVFTVTFLAWIMHCMQAWQEWLTDKGYHLNAEELRSLGYPAPYPTLENWQVLIFMLLILGAALLVFWPLNGGRLLRALIPKAPNWARRVGFGVLFACALYAERVDYMHATTINRMFIAVYLMLLLAPEMQPCLHTRRWKQSAAPLRVFQAMLILQYFASGLSKCEGDWLKSPDVLWTQIQGEHCSYWGALALRSLPRWAWTAQQYLALLFEMGAPIFLMIRALRPVGFILGIGMHLLIALFMRDLIFFSAVMWTFYILFLPPTWWGYLRLWQKPAMNSIGEATVGETDEEGPLEVCKNRIWWWRLGDWQADLLLRCFGLLLYLNLQGHLGKYSLDAFLSRYPSSTLYLGLCGLGLMFLGPRFPLLILTFLVGGDFFLKVLYGEGGSGLELKAAEYPIFVLLPGILILLALFLTRGFKQGQQLTQAAAWERFQSAFESRTVLIFRWTVIMTLFWVCFHKLNSDFFNLKVSCEMVIKTYYGKSWSFQAIPWLSSFSSPLMVVLLEGPICILLLMYFRHFGIVLTACVFGMIAFYDALVITLCVILPALAFLNQEDYNTFRKHWRSFTLVWLALLSIWLPISCTHYLSNRPWIQPCIYQAVVLAVIIFTLGIHLNSWFSNWSHLARLGWLKMLGYQRAQMLTSNHDGGWLLRATAAIWILNGASPYLGLKYNFSFAMLSNLRTDDSRWNHLLVPKWVRLTKHDGFFHVHETKVKYGSSNDAKIKGEVRLKPGLFSPQAFHDEMKRLRDLKGSVELAVLLEYQGRAYDYQGMVDDLKFAIFLDDLPQPHGHWLHNYLSAEGPQGCKH
jgi:hypothetical protein